MPDECRIARPEPAPSSDDQLLLPFGDGPPERPPTVKIYREGLQITAREDSILIEAVDYHARPLLLDRAALVEIGLDLLDRA